jgi:hypothetical protein
MWFCGVLANQLNKSMLLLLELKGKDPNQPLPMPPAPPPEPIKHRPAFHLPWTPTWVSGSFAKGGFAKHPIIKIREEMFAKQAALEEEAAKAQLSPTVIGGDAIDTLREAIFNVEKAIDISQPTRKLHKKIKKG